MYLEHDNGPQMLVDTVNATLTNTTTTTTISSTNTDKSNLGSVIWAVNLTAFVLVGLLVPLRVIVRCTVTRNFFSDDVLVIIAALFTFGICSLLPIATDLGLGQHRWNIDPDVLSDDTRNLLLLMFIANVLYPCAVAFTRLSAVCSFLRVIPRSSMRYTMYTAAAIAAAFAFASVFAVIFQCTPVSAAWDPSMPGASCYPFIEYLHSSSSVGLALDVLLCTMPLPYIWGIKYMSTTKKVMVTVLFLFSGLACAAAVVKAVNIYQLAQDDKTYHWATWVLCSIAECTVGIVCISIPALAPLFAKCGGGGGITGSSGRSTPAGLSRRRRGRSLHITLFRGMSMGGRAEKPRVIRPMATPWKDQPAEPAAVADFHWLKLEQVESGRCWERNGQSSKADQILGIAL
ncbi:hypothetical protein C8034_v004418 [Colletotrichum sidae]|uniref:Rhodopsin domain-containing protein n=1 Tax=Colletotrichum sidae TaxID=1347389 RepID=A0A4R8T8H7_9PEZI|nr:hypothetical protein C8034_v004418 [Colletotrichum sidae]